jgi:hypothetical protein
VLQPPERRDGGRRDRLRVQVPALGRAGRECLAAARLRLSLLLGNDRAVRAEPSLRGVDAMSLPQLLRALWKTGATKKKDAAKLAEGEPRMDI